MKALRETYMDPIVHENVCVCGGGLCVCLCVCGACIVLIVALAVEYGIPHLTYHHQCGYRNEDSEQYLVPNHTLGTCGHNSGQILQSMTLSPGRMTLVVKK